jgi:hypothetical protein
VKKQQQKSLSRDFTNVIMNAAATHSAIRGGTGVMPQFTNANSNNYNQEPHH